VTWGEESRDEMGSISLIAVAHEEAERAALQADIGQRQRELARKRMEADPDLAKRIARLLAE
jgi:hypothetical protein